MDFFEGGVWKADQHYVYCIGVSYDTVYEYVIRHHFDLLCDSTKKDCS